MASLGAGYLSLRRCLSACRGFHRERSGSAAKVYLDHCNGCGRCEADCPYAAITLVPRSDGLPFALEVEVDADRCVSCGICMGACPSSTPFRRSGGLVTGIDLPDFSLSQLRADVIAASGTVGAKGRVLTLACAHGAGAGSAPGRVVLPCVAMAPPSLVDFIISRGLADGVAIVGCAERDCFNRNGVAWTRARFDRQRDPYLRTRVPRERILLVWAGPTETCRLQLRNPDVCGATWQKCRHLPRCARSRTMR